MAHLREKVLTFLRDDYLKHRAHPLESQLGSYKLEEHANAFRVQLKRAFCDGDMEEAQHVLIEQGTLKVQEPLPEKKLRAAAQEALAATPNGTSERRRGNLCERVLECQLDERLGTGILEPAPVCRMRRTYVEEDCRRHKSARVHELSLEGDGFDQLIEGLVALDAEAWLYDAGYSVAEFERQRKAQVAADEDLATVGMAGTASDVKKRAARGPRVKDIPLELVERYQRSLSTHVRTGAAGAGLSADLSDDELQDQICQLWRAMSQDAESYQDVWVPLCVDARSGAGLYVVGCELLVGENAGALRSWCSPECWKKMTVRLGSLFAVFAIVRRTAFPYIDELWFPLKEHGRGVGDTQMANVTIEVLPFEASDALTVANALEAFRDECQTASDYSMAFDFYRNTNLCVPEDCPERFRPLFASDDWDDF